MKFYTEYGFFPQFQRFIDETTAMLQTPTTPDGDTSWETSIQSTPGVIGAQEVYR